VQLLLCSPGFEAVLVREAGGGARVLARGLVAQMEAVPLGASDFVFARQVLPYATELYGGSIKSLARAAVAFLRERVPPGEQTFRLHTLLGDDPAEARPGELARRLDLVAQTVREELKQSQRKLHRRLAAEGPILAQLLLAARGQLFASVSQPVTLPGGGEWPSPLAAGRALVADDWAAPSSAFRKLTEAFAWHGRAIATGERCVDLGAAPGGWSHVALARGARVTAVDRADLALPANPSLEHVRRDGFTFEPPSPPVDWLLCDIIAEPNKSLSLLRTWVERGWATNLVFHLKFKGRGDYAPAQAARALVAGAGFARHRVKHLYHDRNEVTVMAGTVVASQK
jgi:23S rRNA (cytidine2498-2'-O)-methyltransferase